METPKFRAYSKAENKMYRCAGLLAGQVVIITEGGNVIGMKDDDFELMQCLPFSSVDGDEIYEDDIVATGLSKEYSKSIVRIGLTEKSISNGELHCFFSYYGVYLEGTIDLEEFLIQGKMYVLGNVWKNPELLQGEAQ